jgi:hypothetical protein
VSTIDLTVPRIRRAKGETVLGRLGAVLAVAVPRFGRWVRRTVPRARQVVLHAAGLGLLTVAAWSWSTIAGYAAAGVSCLVFEWLSSE